MAPWLRLAILPSSLLLFVTTSTVRAAAQQMRWPYNLPPEVKYYPEDEFLLKRDIDVQQKLQERPVAGVRKMSHDPGEKFYLDYWGFDEEDEDVNYMIYMNDSFWALLDRPIRLHSQPSNQTVFARLPGWNLFSKRGFQSAAHQGRHVRSLKIPASATLAAVPPARHVRMLCRTVKKDIQAAPTTQGEGAAFLAMPATTSAVDILHDYHAVGKHTTYLDKSDLDLDNIPIYEPRASNINSDENCDRDIDPECPDLLHWLPVLRLRQLSCKYFISNTRSPGSADYLDNHGGNDDGDAELTINCESDNNTLELGWFCDRMPNRVLRLLSILPRWMLPDWSELRHNFLPGVCFNDTRVR
ncbi:hypothetical protein RBB50_001188 [Rhinocladiella similis]